MQRGPSGLADWEPSGSSGQVTLAGTGPGSTEMALI